MSPDRLAERRNLPRFDADGMTVYVRRKGRFGKFAGTAIDFNRRGLGIILNQPLPKDSTVTLCIATSTQQIENIVGIVHNCIRVNNGYRCGIQFRTNSALQMDRQETEQALNNLEAAFDRMIGRLNARISQT